MENAQGGVVIESVEALAEYRCRILEMYHIPVNQNLLARHGILVGDITDIHSHQQALRQCKDYLAEHFWTRPLVETDDTAEAARRLSEGKLLKFILPLNSFSSKFFLYISNSFTGPLCFIKPSRVSIDKFKP